jgi:hypothetical protein
MEIISSMINNNLDVLVNSIESLVGIVSFDYDEVENKSMRKTDWI